MPEGAVAVKRKRNCFRSWNSYTGSVKPPQEFNVIIEQDADGYFVASVPELRGCHTQAKSLDTLMKRVREVIELCLEDLDDDFVPSTFVGVQRICI